MKQSTIHITVFTSIDRKMSTDFRAVRPLTSLRTCVWIFPFQEMVYSARRHLQKAIRGTKVTGSEIWRSWVFPVCSQQETLTQLEFCDKQHDRELWQHLPFLSVTWSSNWDQKTSTIRTSCWENKLYTVPVFVPSSFYASIFSSWQQIRSMSVVVG